MRRMRLPARLVPGDEPGAAVMAKGQDLSPAR